MNVLLKHSRLKVKQTLLEALVTALALKGQIQVLVTNRQFLGTLHLFLILKDVTILLFIAVVKLQ